MVPFVTLLHVFSSSPSSPAATSSSQSRSPAGSLQILNWGRQNSQSLQAVLAVAFKKEKQLSRTGRCVRHFVCLCVSRTICVCTGEKWFRTFVRGSVRTENEIVSVCVSTVQYNLCLQNCKKWFNGSTLLLGVHSKPKHHY
jgi:hypothetical protein